QRLNRRELERAGRQRRAAHGAAQVGVEQVRRVAARREPRADLLRGEPGLQNPLANDVGEPGVLLDGLLESLGSLGGWDLTPKTLGSYRQETEQGAQSST